MENNNTPAPVKEKVKLGDRIKAFMNSIPKQTKSKVLKLVLLVAAILLVTNPSLIPFLPRELKYILVGAMTGLLGNVTDISSVIPFNWITLIKLAVMDMLLMVV